MNNINQRAATNQQNHMLWSEWNKHTHQFSLSQDCPSIPLETATLKHAVMQSCGFVWRVITSIQPSSVSPCCHEQLPLSSKFYCTLAPVSLDTGKVAIALLSQRLKCIYKSRQALSSLTLLLEPDVKSCYDANPEQAFQCTTLLLTLGAHKLCRQDRTGAMQRRAEILNSPVSSFTKPSSAAESWL